MRVVYQEWEFLNAGFFSFLVTWGEFALGLGVFLGVLTGIAAGFGVLMNLNYLLAGTVSINPVLRMFGLFLCFSWRICGWISVDRGCSRRSGCPGNRDPGSAPQKRRQLFRRHKSSRRVGSENEWSLAADRKRPLVLFITATCAAGWLRRSGGRRLMCVGLADATKQRKERA